MHQIVKNSETIPRLLGASEGDIADPAKRVDFLRAADSKQITEKFVEIFLTEVRNDKCVLNYYARKIYVIPVRAEVTRRLSRRANA